MTTENKNVVTIYAWNSAFLCTNCYRVYGLANQAVTILCCSDCGSKKYQSVSVRPMVVRVKQHTPWYLRWLVDSYTEEFLGYEIKDDNGNLMQVENNGKGTKKCLKN